MAEIVAMEEEKAANEKEPALANGMIQGNETGKPKSSSARVKRIILANLLVILTVTGVIIGVIIGLCVRSAELNKAQVIYFGFPGELLIRLLKMIIIPLVVCSLISGAASIDPQALGKLGGWAMLFFLATTLIASTIGVVMAFIIQPGSVSKPKISASDEVPQAKDVIDSFLDLIR